MQKENKNIIIVIVSIVLLAAIVVGGVMCFQYFGSPMSKPKYVAHRGLSHCHPDNTVASFTAASENEKYYGIETDIRLTKDGVLVCSHDNTAVFSDGTKLVIEESTYAELTEKTLKNTKSDETERVCLFTDYLKICKKGNKIAVVELKDVFTEQMVAQALKEIDENYDRKQCTVIAFDYDSLYRVRLADPKMDLQYLSSTIGDRNFNKCLKEHISVDVHYSLATKSLVDRFHKKGLEVNVWTVDDKKVQTRMRRNGVDYITSNILCEDQE